MLKPGPKPSDPITSNPIQPGSAPKSLGLLAWIAGYKLAKAAIAVTGAILVFRLGGMNLVAVAHHWIKRIGLDPDSKMATDLVNHLSQINARRIYWTMGVLLAYTLLYCVEAVGLFKEKRWAEWLTVFQTGILVPIEVYEMLYHPGPFKAAALCLSLGVILYLVWRIRQDAPQEAGILPRQE